MSKTSKPAVSKNVLNILKWLRDNKNHAAGYLPARAHPDDFTKFSVTGYTSRRVWSIKSWREAVPFVTTNPRPDRMYAPNRKGLNLLADAGM